MDNEEIKVVAVDDGSSDNSLEVLENIKNKQNNVEVYSTEHLGAVNARRVGMNHVNTKYFGFVDSDDRVRLKHYLKLCHDMDDNNIKVGNGIIAAYFPAINIPISDRKWEKDFIDFTLDKKALSNVTCSLLDKIYHFDNLKILNQHSDQKVYEDMEFVYYVLAKNGTMLHTNYVIYEYRMRGLSGGSTAANGLNIEKSDGLRGLLSAGTSMQEKFKNGGLYEVFKSEIDAVMIKLILQRIAVIFDSRTIKNKKEMALHVIDILNTYLPNWQENKYYLEGFKDSSYNDYLFYIIAKFNIWMNNIDIDNFSNTSLDSLLDEYDKKIKVKRL